MGGGPAHQGLPHPHPTVSYWQSPPHHLANHRSTADLPKEAEYVIVGSGISGATIANNLLRMKPDANIVMLEARTTCSGATGRNGGHCRAGFWDRFKHFVDTYGSSEAMKIEAFENDNVSEVANFIRKEGIDCDLYPCETADIWLEEDEFKKALENLKVRDEVCAKLLKIGKIAGKKIYSGEDARQVFEMPTIAGGVAFDGYQLWPYKLICEMLRRDITKGLNLQTNTPVLSVKRNTSPGALSKHRFVVKTERGQILGHTVVLATNAYTAALVESLSKSIVPTRAQISAVRPGNNIAKNPVLQRSCGLNGHGLSDYFLARPAGLQGEGDIICGGGRLLSKTGEQGTFDDSVINPRIARHLENTTPSYFGRESWGENGKTIMEWTGIMGYTTDGIPLIGEVPDQSGLWVCAGFNGHGMGLAFRSAQAITEMITSGKPPDWFPESMNISRVFK